MRIFVDTQAFLWFVSGDSKLTQTAKDMIEDTKNEKIISNACLWEVAIKVSIKKLHIGMDLQDFIFTHLLNNGFVFFHIEIPHIIKVESLPFNHKDPFDRLLIAQSLIEGIPIISSDVVFDSYGVTRFW